MHATLWLKLTHELRTPYSSDARPCPISGYLCRLQEPSSESSVNESPALNILLTTRVESQKMRVIVVKHRLISGRLLLPCEKVRFNIRLAKSFDQILLGYH